jgi:hypothetical protein
MRVANVRPRQRRAVRTPVGCVSAEASPTAAAALGRANWEIDVRPLLGSIRAPTPVLSRRGDPIGPPDAARYMAERIPRSRFVELDGDDHVLWLGDIDALCGEIEQFVTGVRSTAAEPGSITTILQCDIEGSTLLARELGERALGGRACSLQTAGRPRGSVVRRPTRRPKW